MTALLATAGLADPVAARSQMGLSLGWHTVLACFGVWFPALVVFGEWRRHRTGDPHYRLLAQRWARVLGVAVRGGGGVGDDPVDRAGGAWSGLMEQWGQAMGLPFAIEGIAFFLEAIFLGIYLYGWDRLSPGPTC
jgi:cytochrome d ubiquinol oxidase subunit I